MTAPIIPVGFDYAQAVLEINRHRTYEEIAEFCGYAGESGVRRVIAGSPPSHPQGEAIYALYREIFGRNPPMTREQATGSYAKTHYSAQQMTT